jgi:WD40 repeat protein
VTPDGARILTASDDKTVRIWDAKSGKLLQTLKGHAGKVYSVALSPDGKRILTSAADKTVRIWDADTGKLLRTLEGHGARVNKVAMTPDGTRIVSGSEDKTARVWDTETGAPVLTLQGHDDSIYGLAVMPNGLGVVTGSKDKTVRVWEIPEIPATSAGSQSLIQAAKSHALRCLTPAQRQKYNLACMPPQWCIEMKKWPYDSGAPQCGAAAVARP